MDLSKSRNKYSATRHPAALPPVEVAVDLVVQDRTAPAVLDGCADVPLALGRVFHAVEKTNIVAPWNLSNKLLDDCLDGPLLG
jgi:hypothetical protein